MLKRLVFALSVCAFFAFTVFNVNGQQSGDEEVELKNLIVKADRRLNFDDSETAREYLYQAEQIILQNPGIDSDLQGHFYKVSGKIHMKSSLNQALGYFSAANARFAGNAVERSRVELFMGIAYYYANDLNTAQFYFNKAKTYFIENGDDEYLAHALNNLGVIAFRHGNASAAVDFCEEALIVNSETENFISKLRIQFNLDYFTEATTSDIEDYYEQANIAFGGGGSSGSGTTVKTGGGGTVVVNNGNGAN